MNKPPRPKSIPTDIPPDIPSEIGDRPRYVELTPDEERAFRHEQAEHAHAYRRLRHPQALWAALFHVERSGQTVPHWVLPELFRVVTRGNTDEARRYREQYWYARRYTCVRDLRRTVNERTGKKYTKDQALDQAVTDLQKAGDKAERKTIENVYNKVKKDLERKGRKSEFYYFVGPED